MSTTTSAQNTPAAQQLTILRIKRKRDDEAPDVLLVEPSPKGLKRRRSGTGVFQLAETVDAKELESKEHERELTNRVAKMANAPADIVSKVKDEPSVSSSTSMSRMSSTASSSRLYRVIPKSPQIGRPLKAPPKVLSSKDIAAKASNVRILDAELAPTENTEEVVDPEMEKFQNLLQDYLSMNDKISDNLTATASKNSIATSSAMSTSASANSPDDYVYDIFVRRSSNLPELARMANVATITGLPLSSDDEYESDESEVGDEADEDSNAEDYYAHDYPDGESESEESEFIESEEDSEDDDFVAGNFRWRN